jgi:hypothetical protein
MKTYNELKYDIVERWRWDEITREEMEAKLKELKEVTNNEN